MPKQVVLFFLFRYATFGSFSKLYHTVFFSYKMFWQDCFAPFACLAWGQLPSLCPLVTPLVRLLRAMLCR